MDWQNLKIHSSSLGLLMTEPKEKTLKDAGELSATAKGHLLKVYAMAKYGRRKDIYTIAMEKGTLVEPESITLLSRVEKRFFKKNTERLENTYFTGLPDLFLGDSIKKAEEIHDIKSSWDLDTFLPNLMKPLDQTYYWQLQSYFDLSGAKRGSICYCLSSAPIQIIEQEKRKLLFNMNVATEENLEYKLASAELEKNMVFEDIDIEERVIKFQVERNDSDIFKAYKKVKQARIFLAEIDQKHMSLNKIIESIEQN